MASSKPRIYLYRKCSTCQKALAWLESRQIAFDEFHIYEHPPSKAELSQMLDLYGGDVRKLFNTSGLEYKARGLKDKLPSLSPEAALDLLASSGRLIKRPFVLWKNRGTVGFREEKWQELFAK